MFSQISMPLYLMFSKVIILPDFCLPSTVVLRGSVTYYTRSQISHFRVRHRLPINGINVSGNLDTVACRQRQSQNFAEYGQVVFTTE